MTIDHTSLVYKALCERGRATETEVDAEVNEGCRWAKEVPRTDVAAVCLELAAVGAIVWDGKAWRVVVGELKPKGLLF